MRAILQLAIGIFLLGTALRMLNIHPIFRYFALEPPSFLKRSLRRRAQAGTRDSATPIILGALTVFIPCGITQAMMALAIGAGDPWFGAAIMFAFTLGTSPVFLAMAYLANRLGAAMEARFLKLAAEVVLILGLVAIDTGSTLLGSPFSFAALRDSISVRQALPASAFGLGIQQDVGAKSSSGQAATPSVIAINVSDYGYEPRVLRAKAGQTVQLQVVTKDSVGCTRAFVIPALNLQRVLPETGTTIIDLPAQQAGTLRFTCAMGMFSGAIQFED
jgi:sulfite exporter TauE/SafE